MPQEHPLMQEALRQLQFRLSVYRGLDFDQSTVNSMLETVKNHRQQWRLKGVYFPELVAIVVPRLGIFDLKRADLDAKSVAVSLVNFIRDTPQVSVKEAIAAFRHAYGKLIHVDDMRAGIANARSDMARRAARNVAIDQYVASGREIN
jgi:hypothetical protein